MNDVCIIEWIPSHILFTTSQTAVNTLRNYQTFGSRRPDQINQVEDPN